MSDVIVVVLVVPWFFIVVPNAKLIRSTRVFFRRRTDTSVLISSTEKSFFFLIFSETNRSDRRHEIIVASSSRTCDNYQRVNPIKSNARFAVTTRTRASNVSYSCAIIRPNVTYIPERLRGVRCKWKGMKNSLGTRRVQRAEILSPEEGSTNKS